MENHFLVIVWNKCKDNQEGDMKNILKIIGGGVVVLAISLTAMAVLDICPPQGPWPQPPWCPGSAISWPFSDPPGQDRKSVV